MEESPRILGVDDSLTIRKALELVLKPAGYNLELAASGAEAVEKARTFRPAVMLLDFILPDMRGTEVCKKLAADPETAGIPVVLISAKGAEIRQAYQDVGNVVNYITKPFTPEDVTGVVADVLARAREGILVRPPTVEPVPPPPPPVIVEIPAAPVVVPVTEPVGAPAVPSISIEVSQPAPTVRAPEPVAPVAPPPEMVTEAWEEAEEPVEEESVQAAPLTSGQLIEASGRRDALEMMFETLRAGLEGVYVEEVDTPAGAAADEAKSYTELVSQLTKQLGETLSQARSGLRFALSNGSLRSLDEALLDAFRRVCRLLFRAVAAGAVEQQSTGGRARVLVVCRRDSQVFEALEPMTHQHAEWHALLVAERFRQLPIMTRLYAPTFLVVETARHGALWDQLKMIRKLPEGRRLQIIGVSGLDAAAASVDSAVLAELGVETVIEAGPDLLVALRQKLAPGSKPTVAGRSIENEAAAPAA